MATKNKTVYICNQGAYESAKLYGCCPCCSEWNTMNEEVKTIIPASSKKLPATKKAAVLTLKEIDEISESRYETGLAELDRVLGGGIVKGSLVLLSGDPGIGKSTLLLQICESVGRSLNILYVSGEESAHQLKIRSMRLGVKTENLAFMCDTDTLSIVDHIISNKPGLVIIDSIQTMSIQENASTAGSVTQVRESTNLFMKVAKTLNIPIILVGHVNKDGNIAGPKVLEHIVDAVLYLEGERHLSYRLLRAIKNRFGATDEIGVFEMHENGLTEVENPSLMLISGRLANTSGTCIACIMEGTRPILAEVQGLVTPTSFGTPRRMATGFDYNRMSMLLAVLEKRAGYFFGNMDAYVNIVGGLRLEEPANDLPVALSLVSSLKDVPLSDDAIAFGEIGLAGEIRAVNSSEQRIREALRLGFKKCILPKHNLKSIAADKYRSKIELIGVSSIREAVSAIEK